MPTKDIKRHARGMVEALELRAHAGPIVCPSEIHSAREFLQQHEFSPSSDYFSRLARLQDQITTRPSVVRQEKRNYGGEASGCWMQLQSVYDHIILSTCHEGEFNTQRGRVKISHRFNRAGRIDFVELKLLRSLHPCLSGEIRKLLTVKDFQTRHKDWLEAEAFSLRVLPQELVFLYTNLFRFPRQEILAWLINIGHRTIADLLRELRAGRVNGCLRESAAVSHQLRLAEVDRDEVALPIIEQAAALESSVQGHDSDSVIVRYVRK